MQLLATSAWQKDRRSAPHGGIPSRGWLWVRLTHGSHLDLDPCGNLLATRKGPGRHGCYLSVAGPIASCPVGSLLSEKWVKLAIKVHRNEFYLNFIFLCALKIISQAPPPLGGSREPPPHSHYSRFTSSRRCQFFFFFPFFLFSRLRSLIILCLFQPRLQPGKNKPASLAKAKHTRPNYQLPHCSFGPAGILPAFVFLPAPCLRAASFDSAPRSRAERDPAGKLRKGYCPATPRLRTAAVYLLAELHAGIPL